MNEDPGIARAYLDYSSRDDRLSSVPHGRYLYCLNGSHLALYDDQEVYFRGLIQFMRDVEAGRF